LQSCVNCYQLDSNWTIKRLKFNIILVASLTQVLVLELLSTFFVDLNTVDYKRVAYKKQWCIIVFGTNNKLIVDL